MSNNYCYVYGFDTKLVVIISGVEHLAMAMDEYLDQIDANPAFVKYTLQWPMFEYLEKLGVIRKDKPIEVYHTCPRPVVIEKMKNLVGYTITYKDLIEKLPSTNQV